jgi:hypothetical protein
VAIDACSRLASGGKSRFIEEGDSCFPLRFGPSCASGNWGCGRLVCGDNDGCRLPNGDGTSVWAVAENGLL